MDAILPENIFLKFRNLSDITLITEDGCKFRAHKILLAQTSRYFETLFCGNFKHSIQTLVPIVKGEILQEILCYIYEKKDILTTDNVSDILLASDYLIIDELFKNCNTFILNGGITVDNCIQVFNCAWKIELDDIKTKCKRFIEIHCEEAFMNPMANVRNMPLPAIKEILECDNLNISDESIVWNIVISWIKGNAADRMDHFPEILKYVRLQEMDEILINKMELPPVFKDNPFCFDFSFINNIQTAAISKMMEQAKALPLSITGLRGPRIPTSIYFICKQVPQRKAELFITYDFNFDYWYYLGKFPLHRDVNYTEICIAGQFVYFSFYNNPTRIKAFDLIRETWTFINSVPQRRSLYTAVSINDDLYALGGMLSMVQSVDSSFIDINNIGRNPANILFNQINAADVENLNPDDDNSLMFVDLFDDEEAEDGNDNLNGNQGEETNDINENLDHALEDEAAYLNSDPDDEHETYGSVELPDEEANTSADEPLDDEVQFSETDMNGTQDLHDDYHVIRSRYDVVQRYNRESNTWQLMHPMNAAHIIRAVTLNNMIYVIGEGVDYEEMVCQFYDPNRDSWTLIPTPEFYRTNCAVVTFCGKLYLIGGQNRYFADLRKVEEYNPTENSWRLLPDLPYIYFDPEAIVIKNTILVYDQSALWGENHTSVTWDSEMQSWRTASFISEELLTEMRRSQIIVAENQAMLKELIGKHKRKRSVWKDSSSNFQVFEDYDILFCMNIFVCI
nr:kelch-like protein 23 [Parasteatoda tepidariorum]